MSQSGVKISFPLLAEEEKREKVLCLPAYLRKNGEGLCSADQIKIGVYEGGYAAMSINEGKQCGKLARGMHGNTLLLVAWINRQLRTCLLR